MTDLSFPESFQKDYISDTCTGTLYIRFLMQPTITNKEAFWVIGIGARTNNADEMSGQGVIGKQWVTFCQEFYDKIPNKADRNMLALYTNYESDKDGAYDFIIGARVSDATQVPEGMIAVQVPATTYAVFTSNSGPSHQVVPETWMHIWSLRKDQPGGNRSYRTDYEVYDERAANPEQATIDVYIGINS